jgi:hypothetical protein
VCRGNKLGYVFHDFIVGNYLFSTPAGTGIASITRELGDKALYYIRRQEASLCLVLSCTSIPWTHESNPGTGFYSRYSLGAAHQVSCGMTSGFEQCKRSLCLLEPPCRWPLLFLCYFPCIPECGISDEKQQRGWL